MRISRTHGDAYYQKTDGSGETSWDRPAHQWKRTPKGIVPAGAEKARAAPTEATPALSTLKLPAPAPTAGNAPAAASAEDADGVASSSDEETLEARRARNLERAPTS